MNILANDGISPSGEQALRDAGFTLFTEFVDADNLQAFIHEHAIDGILVRSATKVRQPLIDACPTLKFIGRGGVGMDNIDVEYARNQGLTVFNPCSLLPKRGRIGHGTPLQPGALPARQQPSNACAWRG